MAKGNKNITVHIESRTVIQILVLGVLTLMAIVFLQQVARPLVLIFISFFLAMALNPAVSWIADRLKSKSRVAATGVAYVAVLTFLISFFALVFPPLVKQTVDFIKEVPDTIREFKQEDSAFNKFIDKYQLDDEVEQFSSDFGSKFKDLGKPALSTAGAIGSMVVSLITVLVLTFMMLVEGPFWLQKIAATLPVNKREHHKKLAYKMYRVVVGFVNGQVFIAALGGAFAAIALFILSQVFDAPVNAIALGGIVGLFALMPLIGTIMGSVIVVLACMLVSVPLALSAAVYFVIYQQIENVTIQPYVQSKSNNLTPLSVFVAALLGVGFGGLLGALIAIPVAGCIKILVDDYFEQRLKKKLSEA